MSQIKIQFINENKKVGLKNIYKISSSRENNLIKSENNQKKNIYFNIGNSDVFWFRPRFVADLPRQTFLPDWKQSKMKLIGYDKR